MSDDEEILFQQEMADVKPLQQERRVTRRRDGGSDASLAQRRAAATEEKADLNPLDDEGVEPLDPWYVLEFKRPGVQNGVYRKLKQGRYEAEARLNLHRRSLNRARSEVFEFVKEAEALGLRCVHLVHGKGENSGGREREQLSVVKGYVNHWLRQLEAVQAFHSAKPQHGGTGAVYVLLRKGERAKQENRIRFRGRSE